MKNKEQIISERLRPQIWQWGYLVLKPILCNLKNFAERVQRENARKILDLGCGRKPYEEIFSFCAKFVGFDIERNEKVDVVGVNWDLPFQDDEFDALISTQVLEHTARINETVAEITRVVKNNGLIFISVPFAFPEHGVPYDYFRFTKYGLREIFRDFEVLEVIPSGGYISTLMRLWNVFIFSFFKSNLIFAPIFLLNNLVGLLADKIVIFICRLIGKRTIAVNIKNIYFGFPENYSIILRNKK